MLRRQEIRGDRHKSTVDRSEEVSSEERLAERLAMLPRGTQVCNPRNTTVLLRSKLLESHPVVIAVSAEQYASTTWRSKNASSMTKTGRRTTLRGAIYMLQAVLAGIIPLKATRCA